MHFGFFLLSEILLPFVTNSKNTHHLSWFWQLYDYKLKIYPVLVRIDGNHCVKFVDPRHCKWLSGMYWHWYIPSSKLCRLSIKWLITAELLEHCNSLEFYCTIYIAEHWLNVSSIDCWACFLIGFSGMGWRLAKSVQLCSVVVWFGHSIQNPLLLRLCWRWLILNSVGQENIVFTSAARGWYHIMSLFPSRNRLREAESGAPLGHFQCKII